MIILEIKYVSSKNAFGDNTQQMQLKNIRYPVTIYAKLYYITNPNNIKTTNKTCVKFNKTKTDLSLKN